MRIFVTGASGWIGSAVVPELIAAGHQVTGLARSDTSADKIARLGADVQRGDLDDLAGLRTAAEASDGVVHLGYHHDFSQIPEAARLDRAAIDTFGDALAGSDRPLLVASGALGLGSGFVATEQDRPAEAVHPRIANAAATLALADRGVRSIVVRFAPTVHGEGDHGFISVLVDVARKHGASGYVGDGTNCWPAVHRLDAGTLVARAIDRAPAGSVLHATAEQGVPTREIAEAIGRGLGVRAMPVPAEQAADHFGWIGMFFGLDCQVSSEATRKLLDWHPTHPGLIADLDEGHYFRS